MPEKQNTTINNTEQKNVPEVYRKINTICLIVLAAVSLTIALAYTKTILIPLVISVFIFTMVTPITRYIRVKFKLAKWLSMLIGGALVIIPLIFISIFLIQSISNFLKVISSYQQNITALLTDIGNFFAEHNIPISQDFFEFDTLSKIISVDYGASIMKNISGMTIKLLSGTMLVILFLFFLFIGGSSTKITNPLIKEIQNKISAYLFIHIIMSIVTGVCVGIVYYSVGIKLAFTFAVLTIILNFIPNIGSVIAVLLPLPIAYMQYGFGAHFLIVLLIPTAAQIIIGSILEPKFLGNGMDLHPVTIISSLVFWALVWGIPGAFLAVPITSAVHIILSKIEPTKVFAEIMSGRLPR
ncbi:MAG: AI-2E family transporter [Elusimicrobiaceae bacterium]|nr:AI-2E family transporter [Elusimicrobiaceae bacterium]